jgi:hypothetical protein
MKTYRLNQIKYSINGYPIQTPEILEQAVPFTAQDDGGVTWEPVEPIHIPVDEYPF